MKYYKCVRCEELFESARRIPFARSLARCPQCVAELEAERRTPPVPIVRMSEQEMRALRFSYEGCGGEDD